MTGIDYNQENRLYSIFVKVYCDDLESDMKLGYIKDNNHSDSGEQMYLDYLNDRVRVYEDKKQLKMKLLSSESDGIERRFVLEAKGGKEVKNITIVNSIMIRLYSDMANMLLFRYKDIEEGYKFTASDTLRNYLVK